MKITLPRCKDLIFNLECSSGDFFDEDVDGTTSDPSQISKFE